MFNFSFLQANKQISQKNYSFELKTTTKKTRKTNNFQEYGFFMRIDNSIPLWLMVDWTLKFVTRNWL